MTIVREGFSEEMLELYRLFLISRTCRVWLVHYMLRHLFD